MWHIVSASIGGLIGGLIVWYIMREAKAELMRENKELRDDLYDYQASHGFDKVKG